MAALAGLSALTAWISCQLTSAPVAAWQVAVVMVLITLPLVPQLIWVPRVYFKAVLCAVTLSEAVLIQAAAAALMLADYAHPQHDDVFYPLTTLFITLVAGFVGALVAALGAVVAAMALSHRELA